MPSTYGDILDDLEEYTNYDDTDFVAKFPTFVQAAEERIWFLVQIPDFQANVTGVFVSGSPYLELPSDFLAAGSLAVINTGTLEFSYLLNKDSNYIREIYPVAATSGLPRFYGLFDAATIIVGPTPNANYAAELQYYYRPASLTFGNDTANTTWLSENAYNTLLYGALSEASNYLKKTQGIDDMGGEYEKRFVLGLQGLKNLGESRDQKDTYRSGEKRIPE